MQQKFRFTTQQLFRQFRSLPRNWQLAVGGIVGGAALAVIAVCYLAGGFALRAAGGGTGYRGTITFEATNSTNATHIVADVDVASGRISNRFDGGQPDRNRRGETVLAVPLDALDHGSVLVIGDAQGWVSAPIFQCPEQVFGLDCRYPRWSPDGERIALVINESYAAEVTVVIDRQGNELARYPSFSRPGWTPDGDLLLVGTPAIQFGLYLVEQALGELQRIDNNRDQRAST